MSHINLASDNHVLIINVQTIIILLSG